MLKILLTIIPVISSIVILYNYSLFKKILKQYSIRFGHTNGIYNVTNQTYVFSDDYGIKHIIKREREIPEDIAELHDRIPVYICYSRLDPDQMYECDEFTEEMEIKKIKKTRRKTYIIAILALIISSIINTFV